MTWQNDSSADDRFELDPRRHADIYARDPFHDDEQMEGDGEFEEEKEEEDDDLDEDDDEFEDDDDLEEEEEEEDDL